MARGDFRGASYQQRSAAAVLVGAIFAARHGGRAFRFASAKTSPRGRFHIVSRRYYSREASRWQPYLNTD